MANIKITDLAAIADPISTDVLPIVDVSADVTNKISIEDLLKSAADGTAAAPAFAFDSDPDTGAYRTGANGLGFSTGGTGRLFIDSSGNLGVGTSTPNYLLDVEQADASARINALTGNSSVYLTCADNTGIATLFLGDAASPTTGQIKYRNNGDSLAFEVSGSERIRVTSSGNVGIGTTVPSSKLHVYGTENNSIARVENADGTNGYGLFVKGGGTTSGRYVASFQDAAGNTRLHVLANGNVGINETNPGQRLVIGGDMRIGFTTPTDAARSLEFDSNRSGAGQTLTNINFKWNSTVVSQIRAIAGADTTNKDDGELAFYTTPAGSIQERMRIDSSGNVGIGTSSPATKLHVSSSGDTIARITSADGNGAFLDLGDASDPDGGRIVYDSGSNLTFSTASSERMRIDSSGNVGIGTNGPASRLHLAQDSAHGIRLQRTGASPSNCYISNTSNVLELKNSASGIVFNTGGSETARINNSGQFGIGTSSPGSYSSVANNLVVQDTAGEGGITIVSTTTGGSNIFFADTDSASQGQIKYQHAGDYMRFYTANAERLRIGSAGQIGLGGANYGTSGQVLTSNGSGSAPTWQTASGGGGLYDDYAIFQHTTSSGTSAGATSTSTWNVRPINTTAVSQTWASVASNQITLSAGTYSIEWQATIYRSNMTQSRFRNITDSTTAALGLSVRSEDAGGGGGFGKTTIASSKAFELQHYTSSNDTNGLGLDAGSGENNVFATIKITKHA